MTGGSDIREKTRAVFLAFVMITSVFGATVALSGSAAAADTTGPTIEDVEADGGASSDILFVTFSEGVFGGAGDDSLQAGDFSFDDDTSGTTVSSVTHDAGDAFAIVKLSNADVEDADDLDSAASGGTFSDAAGNDQIGSDITQNVDLDDQPEPVVAETEPGTAVVEVVFSERITGIAGDGSDFSSTLGNVQSATLNNNGRTATLELDTSVTTNDLGSNSISFANTNPSERDDSPGSDGIPSGTLGDGTENDVNTGPSSNNFQDTTVPRIASAETRTTDTGDGELDEVVVTLTEPISDSDSTLDTGTFSYGGSSLDAVTTGDTADDNTVVLEVSGDGDTGSTPTVDLDHTTGDLSDGTDTAGQEDAASLGVDLSSVSSTDGATPIVTRAEVVDQTTIDVDVTEQLTNSDQTVTINGNSFAGDSSSVASFSAPGSGGGTATFDLDDVGGANSINNNLRLSPGDDVSITIDDGAGQSTQPDVTSNLLDVSVSPADSTRSSTPTISVDIDNPDGSDFAKNAQVAVVGLNNDNSDNQARDDNSDNPVDSDSTNVEYDIVSQGSTSGGTFTTAVTLNGVGSTTLINEYFVVVRKGSTKFKTANGGDDVFDATAPSTTGNLQKVQGSALLSAAPDVSVDSSAQSVERGESVTISGSVTTADPDTSVSGQTISIDSPVTNDIGTATTADNGDFATSATLPDAATHNVTLQLYNSSINSIERDSFETIDVTPNSVDVTSDTQSISSLQKSGDITLDMPDVTAVDANITRYKLSGVTLEQIDLTNDGEAEFEQITLTDGTTIGGVSAPGSPVDAGPDPNGDNTDEFSTHTTTNIVVGSNSNENIQSVVILAKTGDGNDENEDVVLQVDPAESGTLTAEAQVEDDTDGGDTPTSPDFVGSADISVPAPGDLTALANPASIDLGDAQTDADNTDDVTVSVLDSDGAGLSDQSDANIDNGDIQAVTITLTGNDTEFALESEGGEDTGIGGLSSYDNTGESLSEASITIENEDTSNGDTTTEDFVIESLEAEQNGTVDITVTADVVNQNSDITANSTVRFTDSDTAVDLSPSTELTSSSTTSISLNLTDGTGTPVNNRNVDIFADGGVGDDDLFNVDTDGDGDNEQTGVDLIRINGQTNQIEFDTDGQSSANDGSVPFTVNNGEYRVDGVEINSPGQSVTVQAVDSGNIKANFPSQFTTVGQSTFDIESDVDPLVAGFQEQANLTVTNTTSGAEINGSALNDLLDNDAASDTITQEGNDISSAGADLTSGDAVDLDGDGTNDAIQVDITPQSTADVNISIDNGDGTETGSGTIGVVEPEIETNVENNVLTERLNQSVDVTAIDPRDGSRLASGDETADIRVTVLNGTAELRDLDNKHDSVSDDVDDTGSDPDSQAFELNDDGDSTRDALVASDVANSNLSLAALPYDPDNEQFKLEFQVDSDAGNFFGSTNVTVEPPQVTATPSSITLGSQETLEVIAEDANGNALAQRSIRLDGAVQPISGSTDDSGFVAVTVNPQATGTINVHTASADDIETSDLSPAAIDADGSIEDTVNVTTEQNEFNVTVDPQTVTANESSTVTVTATNNASGDAVEGASVDLSGAGVNQSAQTDANGQATFDVNASQAGTIDVTVDDAGFTAATASITVQQPSEPANFTVSNVTPDGVNVTAGDNITVSADIENVGGQPATQSVEFRIVAADGNTAIDNASATETQNVSLDAGANRTVTFENVSTDGLAAGDFTHGVFSANDSATATITLQEAADEPAVATVTFDDKTVPNGTSNITVESAEFGGGEYNIVVHQTTDANGDGTIQAGEIGKKIGESDALPNGTATNISVDIGKQVADNDNVSQLTETQTLVAMLHTTNTSDGDNITHASPITRDGTPVFDEAEITVEDQGLVARFDENDNGEIELTEVQTAIRAFSDDDLTLTEIQTLIREFSG